MYIKALEAGDITVVISVRCLLCTTSPELSLSSFSHSPVAVVGRGRDSVHNVPEIVCTYVM